MKNKLLEIALTFFVSAFCDPTRSFKKMLSGADCFDILKKNEPLEHLMFRQMSA